MIAAGTQDGMYKKSDSSNPNVCRQVVIMFYILVPCCLHAAVQPLGPLIPFPHFEDQEPQEQVSNGAVVCPQKL